MQTKTRLAAAAAIALATALAQAQTVRIANQGDALSMDPHSLNESLQLSVDGNIYEGLVGRGKDLSLVPALATSWKQTSPTVWRFELRKGVQFHDGTPFTADDVVFSFARAAGDGSDMRANVNDIKAVRKISPYEVEIETKSPFPILPNQLTTTYILSKKWCEDNQATKPVDRRKGIENAASFRANGTGPYRLRERQPGVRTVFVRNGNYWGKIDGNAQEIIFTPIGNDATRVAALLSGEVDVMEPVPVQDIDRINASAGAKVLVGPELRTIFLGMDQKRDELQYSSVKGKNPFKDKRVRQAFYQAIDINGIQKTVMRGASRPSAEMIGPGVHGYEAAMDKRLPYDPDAAKKLLAEAGYPNGFEVTMNCPNDRYVNDARICQAVAANLSRIGVKINLAAEPKATYFPKVLRRDTSFYMLGWTPSTYDAHDALNSLMACPDESGAGHEAVIGHEISHIANGDMVTMTLIQGVMNTFVVFLSRVIGYIVDGALSRSDNRSGPGIGYFVTTIVLDIVFGFLAAIIVAWFSRQREFRADRGSVQLLGSNQPMIHALARLGGMVPGALPKGLQTMGITSGVGRLFSTHPPIEERIAALQAA